MASEEPLEKSSLNLSSMSTAGGLDELIKFRGVAATSSSFNPQRLLSVGRRASDLGPPAYDMESRACSQTE